MAEPGQEVALGAVGDFSVMARLLEVIPGAAPRSSPRPHWVLCVLSASRSNVESIGLEALFNADCIADFLAGGRKVADLPELRHVPRRQGQPGKAHGKKSRPRRAHKTGTPKRRAPRKLA